MNQKAAYAAGAAAMSASHARANAREATAMRWVNFPDYRRDVSDSVWEARSAARRAKENAEWARAEGYYRG